ncbi:hypothetical protein [Cohnella abietis]|uniref:SnoaL-like domain-containing protein n=1 Tax=Cohnella abietis TaxID=2507935 RepID=A0A3T1D706_9BACL|nr:hypothetical protein [Cohnella abietis]BBI33862.1 hypothetical protein KCTCHS21_32610 [Cohnella abietis]
MIRKILLVSILSLILVSTSPAYANSKNTQPITIVKKVFEDVNEQKWCSIPELWTSKQRESYSLFFCKNSTSDRSDGLFNIKKASIIDWRELPSKIGINHMSNGVRQAIEDEHLESKFFYVAVDLQVKIESKYFINGTNYPLFALIKEKNNDWRIIQMSVVPTSSMIQNGYGFNTQDEKTFDERRLQYT